MATLICHDNYDHYVGWFPKCR